MSTKSYLYIELKKKQQHLSPLPSSMTRMTKPFRTCHTNPYTTRLPTFGLACAISHAQPTQRTSRCIPTEEPILELRGERKSPPRRCASLHRGFVVGVMNLPSFPTTFPKRYQISPHSLLSYPTQFLFLPSSYPDLSILGSMCTVFSLFFFSFYANR